MKLFSWGANTHGQLCNGETKDMDIPFHVEAVEKEGNLNLEAVAHIQGGSGFIHFLTNSGEVFSCGSNQRGQLGLGHLKNFHVLQRNNLLGEIDGKIIKIACGCEHTLSLTDKGKVYVWGSNKYHQLGLESPSTVTEPTELKLSFVIKDIAAGLRHSLAVTETGQILSWGSGRKGQLGFDENIIRSPTPIPNISNVCKVAVGEHHSAFLNDFGNVYIFGSNKYGQLGVDPKVVDKSSKPVSIAQSNFCEEKIEEIHSGWSHLIAEGVCKDSRSYYAWGRNDYCQLGCKPKSFWTPTKIAAPLESIAVGSEYNISRNKENKLVAWGWNEHGICGTGCTENFIAQPTIINSLSKYGVHTFGTNYGSCYVIVS